MLNEQQETNTENVQTTEQTQTAPVDTAAPPVDSQTQEQNRQKLTQKPSQIFLNLQTLTKWSWKALILMHSNLMKITKLF